MPGLRLFMAVELDNSIYAGSRRGLLCGDKLLGVDLRFAPAAGNWVAIFKISHCPLCKILVCSAKINNNSHEFLMGIRPDGL